jgi:hypothetical protein
MTPKNINASIMQQERLRQQAVSEEQLKQDSQAFKIGTISDREPIFGLWNVQVGDAKVKATSLTNAGLEYGQTVYYYKVEGQAYGYIKTQPIG